HPRPLQVHAPAEQSGRPARPGSKDAQAQLPAVRANARTGGVAERAAFAVLHLSLQAEVARPALPGNEPSSSVRAASRKLELRNGPRPRTFGRLHGTDELFRLVGGR